MFKKVKVVMLPTKQNSNIYHSINGRLYFEETPVIDMDIRGKNQHLYFLSDEEIKEGDWYIFTWAGEKDIQKFSKEQYNDRENHKHLYNYACKKIIATTDKSLVIEGKAPSGDIAWRHPLPEPSESFLEKFVEEYNKGNKIETVDYRNILEVIK